MCANERDCLCVIKCVLYSEDNYILSSKVFGCFRIQVQKLTAPLIGHPLFGLLMYGLALEGTKGFHVVGL